EKEIEKLGFGVDVSEFLSFIKEATAAREFAKFQFTKALSLALNVIVRIGEEMGFSREDLQYLEISEFLKLNAINADLPLKEHLKNLIEKGKHWYSLNNILETPQIIKNLENLDIIVHNGAMPNFVT